MHPHVATVRWSRRGAPFVDNRYARAHEWTFDGGLTVPASSSPAVVPAPLSDPAAVDPEEALVAAASSCHMLFFLALAAKRGLVVDEYVDEAQGVLGRRDDGRTAFTRIVLRPRVRWDAGRQPDAHALAELHEEAHARCYVSNSLTAEVVVEPA